MKIISSVAVVLNDHSLNIIWKNAVYADRLPAPGGFIKTHESAGSH